MDAPGGADAGFQALGVEAGQGYQPAIEAQRDGDWARYGEELRRLGEVLERLAARR